jgi:hypothetical protein
MYPVSQAGRRGGTQIDHKSSDATSSQEHIIESIGTTSEVEAGLASNPDHVRSGNGISKTVEFEISERRVGEGRV